jgi:N-acetyl-anhydromuramyl-L-alanine amidase AmpD
MLFNIRNVTTKVKQAVGNIDSLLNSIRNAIDSAKGQFEKLRNSPLDAVPGAVKLGIKVITIADESYTRRGDVKRRFSIGVLGDELSEFGSLSKSPQNSDANTFYKQSRTGANLNRTVTAVTTDAVAATLPPIIKRDPDKSYTAKELTTKVRSVAEKIYDGVADNSTTKPLLNTATDNINKTSKFIEEKITSTKVTSNSILENVTDTTDLQDNIVLDNKSDGFGVSSVEVIEMKNIKSRTILKTYEEMESIIRSCTRDITEVVVHHTDTYEDQDIDYDDVYSWHTARNFKDVGYHFLILRNGDLQVARPISQIGAHCLKGHNPFSIGIAFVGGIVGSSSKRGRKRDDSTFRPEQWNTFKAFMRAFYTVHPGGQAWGHVDIDPERRSDPNFDVPSYVKNIFGKENIQTKEQTRSTGALSTDEMIGLQ